MTQGYRILLFPLTKGFSSHLRNFLKVAEILTEAGHDVTILVNDRVLEHVQDAHGQILTFKVTEDIPLQIQEDLLSLTSFLGLRRQAQLNIGILQKLCDILFTQNDVLKHLREQKFELIIADSWNLCNNVLIRYLDVPSILYNNNNNNNNNGPNGHLFYVGGDLMMRRGMLPIIMLPDGDLRIVLHLVPFWILTIWGSVHIEETVVGWRNQLRMKTSVT